MEPFATGKSNQHSVKNWMHAAARIQFSGSRPRGAGARRGPDPTPTRPGTRPRPPPGVAKDMLMLGVGSQASHGVHLGVRLSPYQRYRYSLSSGTQGAGAVRYRPSSGTGGAGTGRVTVLGVLGALRY